MLWLPLLVWMLATAILYRPPLLRLPAAWLCSAIFPATLIVFFFSGMGAILQVNAQTACGLWAILLLWMLAKCFQQKTQLRRNFRRAPRRFRTWVKGMSPLAWLCLGVISIVLCLTLLVAVLAIPNNYDSLTYHLPRIMHWVQNDLTTPYPTNNVRQIYQHPGAEYLQLQVFLLAPGWLGAMNLVQWASLVGSIFATGISCRYLGVSKAGQWLAMVLVATLPMAIFQSTNTKNDLLLGCLTMLAVSVLASFTVSKYAIRRGTPIAMFKALALIPGWILLVKGTGYVLIGPLIACSALLLWRRRGWKFSIRTTLCTSLITLLFMFTHWLFVAPMFGSIFGPESDMYRPHGNPIAAVVTNAVRNIGSQLTTPVASINEVLTSVMSAGLNLVGLNLQDPRSMTITDHYFLFTQGMLSEDHASAPIHMLLILIALAMVLIKGKLMTRTYALVWLSGALLFCGLVSWNQWITRLQLPLMFAAIPLVVIALKMDRWKPRLQRAMVLLVFVATIPALLFNYNRSLLGSTSLLTHSPQQAQLLANPELQMAVKQAVMQIQRRDIHELGLVFGEDEPEFLFWQALVLDENHLPGDAQAIKLQHKGVQNQTQNAQLKEPPFEAQWLLVSQGRATSTLLEFDGLWYQRVWQGSRYSLYQLAPEKQ